MEAVVKKHFWLVNLVFLALGAWLLAGSINGVIAHKLRQIPSMNLQASKASSLPRQSTEPSRDYQRITDLNYFESALTTPVEQGPAIDDSNAKNLPEVLSSLNAALRGTIVAEPSAWSMALITDKNKSETGAYRIGDLLMDEAKVVAILSDKVVLTRSGQTEYLELQDQGAAKVASGPKMPPPPAGVPPNEPSGEGIRKVNDDKYVIARSEIDATLNNLNNIAMQARIVPSFKNGESDGFKLFAIRPGSLYSKIGIQNGDIIHKINGFPINSPDKALEVYQKLKSARSIDVELTRRGQTKSLNYEIQ